MSSLKYNFGRGTAAATGGVDWEYIPLTSGSTDLTKSGSGTYTYQISEFTGSNLITANIRGVFILLSGYSSANNGKVSVKMPNGDTIIIFENRDAGDDNTTVSNSTYIPINKNQISLELIIDQPSETTVSFTIVGINQIKLGTLTPEVDFIHLLGNVATPYTNHYVDATKSIQSTTSAWISSAPDTLVTGDFSTIFPIVIPSNVGKTEINGTFKQTSITGAQDEDYANVKIVIDWDNDSVKGIYEVNQGSSISVQTGGSFKGTIAAITTIPNLQGSGYASYNPVLEISGKTITKLPLFLSLASFNYTITNYKTKVYPVSNYDQKTLTGTAKLYNNATYWNNLTYSNPIPTLAEGTPGSTTSASAAWYLIKDDNLTNNTAELSINTFSSTSKVLISCHIHTDISNNETPVVFKIQRSINGGSTWTNLGIGDISSIRLLGTFISNSAPYNRAMNSNSYEYIDTPNFTGLVKYRILYTIYPDNYLTLNRDWQLDSDGDSGGVSLYETRVSSNFIARELF